MYAIAAQEESTRSQHSTICVSFQCHQIFQRCPIDSQLCRRRTRLPSVRHTFSAIMWRSRLWEQLAALLALLIVGSHGVTSEQMSMRIISRLRARMQYLHQLTCPRG